ncbi:hypothetical protein GCK72_012900 [Caenorhabditis remanei]|uniref:Uncharacterized protein n=1 Tax=Caenorhabditis remanei TaxID=31234 RepID=A0A6A5GMC4_CAERE|nr:hypothetical protein GCK72_012900 [Caenorhabditis remanei]KAF1756447.1 hypothetical protein GCK72_012900 [Caenorhabditis remanei]
MLVINQKHTSLLGLGLNGMGVGAGILTGSCSPKLPVNPELCPVGDGILLGVGGSSGLDSRLGACGAWVTVDQDSDENGINVGNPDDVVGSVVVGTSGVGVIVSNEDLEAPPTLASPEFEPGFRFKFEFEFSVHVASTLVGGAGWSCFSNDVIVESGSEMKEAMLCRGYVG